jgi:hypothetical protein
MNIAVRGKLFNEIEVLIHPQGVGTINNLGYGGMYFRDWRNRVRNLEECFVSPVVHQFDRMPKKFKLGSVERGGL